MIEPLKILAPTRKQKSQRLRIGSASNKRTPGPRSRQSAVSNAHEHSGAALAAELSDKSMTTDNPIVRQIMEHKLRNLIDHRNAIVDAPNFASNIKAKGEVFEGNEPEDLVEIDNKLDSLERHLDGHDQLALRFNRTTEMLARLNQEFAEYRRILEENDGAAS
jgi:hypothetical protein